MNEFYDKYVKDKDMDKDYGVSFAFLPTAIEPGTCDLKYGDKYLNESHDTLRGLAEAMNGYIHDPKFDADDQWMLLVLGEGCEPTDAEKKIIEKMRSER